MLFSSTLRSRVMPVINARIREAENRLEDSVSEIDKQTSETISAIVSAANERKETVLEECVDSILN